MNEVSPRALGRSLIASAIAFGLIFVSAGGAVGVARAPAQRNLKTVPMSSWKGPRYVAGQVLVRFRHGEQPSSAAAVGARAIRALTVKGWTLVTLRGNESVDHAIARFRARADVGDVTANHVSAAWDITTGSSSVIVAVADSGVDGLHPDLKPNLTTGINFVPGTPSSDTSDDFGHGTHVAGIIGAAGNDGYGVTGVAQHVKMMPIRVLDQFGSGDTSTIAEGFTYAATHGARAVNASLGGPDPDPVLQQAITSHPGTLFVVAAGNNHTDNDTTPDYPCNYTTANLICVAASDQNDQLASFSNFGAHTVHLAAPGYHIGSTVPTSSAGFGGSGFALSDSPNGPYANNADTWAEASQTIDPNGSTSCNLTYRLHLDLAPNDSLTVETSPDTLPRVWSPVGRHRDGRRHVRR
ncbi:MAG: hypothetical protein E6G59_10525 [Actinobacteria bacterium]|nr:MAG: hypothetical protein E6G59_10525 [Actinomycetota bacterium]